MSIRTLRSVLSTVSVAAAVFLSGTASAAYYGGDFDPLFFNGTATFQIGDNCLNNGAPRTGQFLANSNFFNCTNVDMHDTPTPVVFLHNGVDPQTTLDFSTFQTDSVDMLLVAVVNGAFEGIFTAPIGQGGGIGFRANDQVHYPDWYFLQFVYSPIYGNQDNIAGVFNSHDHAWDEGYLTGVTNSVLLWDCKQSYFSLRSDKCTLADTAVTVSFALIPEPGTLALIVGGLGAGWLSRRRKASK